MVKGELWSIEAASMGAVEGIALDAAGRYSAA